MIVVKSLVGYKWRVLLGCFGDIGWRVFVVFSGKRKLKFWSEIIVSECCYRLKVTGLMTPYPTRLCRNRLSKHSGNIFILNSRVVNVFKVLVVLLDP